MEQVKNFFKNPIIKIITKIISWVVLVFLVLLALLLIYYVISSKIYEIKGKNYEPAVSLYTIISPSMEPAIKVYDVVVTRKVTDPSTIKEGDIITYVSTSTLGEGLTITHRVKSVITTDNGVKFRTQGDNNAIADSALVSSDHILGKVMFKIPLLGHVQFLLQSKGGLLFVLLIPALIVVIYDVVKVVRLSSIKQKVEESIKAPEENIQLKNKTDNLKKDLKQKYIGVAAVRPIIEPVNTFDDNTKENITPFITNEVQKDGEDEYFSKENLGVVKNIEPAIINDNINDFDMNKVLNNIEKVKDEEEKFDVNKVMVNISKLNSLDDSLTLPKTKN